MKATSGTRRSEGSALIIVLGLLAVLMMLGLTFSVFARTEHAGSTNLKNGAVARQSLQTAIGHVMEAIDLSFGSPSNNWPVCVWPQAWLASSELEAEDYYQSEILDDGVVPAAQILTDDAAKFLTPSQLALAKSAAVGWAPIYAAIESEGPRKDTGGGLIGNKGRDNADSVVGRYAFIALETTGLLDANAAGSVNGSYDGDNRADNTGDNPFTYILPASGDKAKFENVKDLGDNVFETETVEIPHTLKNRSALVSARDGTTQISSFADLCAVAGSALDGTKPGKPSGNNAADLAAKLFPADLFNTFYASLADLDPDGQPKVAFPTGSGEQEIRRFAARAFPAMVKVFANARADTSTAGGAALDPSSNEGDQYTFFEGSGKEYALTRARLAAIAAIDAQDSDSVPCQSTAANNFSALQSLPDFDDKVSVVDAEGQASVVRVKDTLQRSIRLGSPLNLPCTENVPLLSRVGARVVFDPDQSRYNVNIVNSQTQWQDSFIQFDGQIYLYAIASCPGADAPAGSYTLDVTCDYMASSPAPGTTSKAGGSDDVADSLWTTAGNAGRPDQQWQCEDLDNFRPAAHYKTVPSKYFSQKTVGKNIIVETTTPIPFQVICGVAANPANAAALPAAARNVCIQYPGPGGTWYFYPPTKAEESANGYPFFIPFRFKAQIKGPGGTVQQVPAPALDDDARSNWVTAWAAISYEPDAPWDRYKKSVWGWAFCLDPTFGMDTTSLRVGGDGSSVPGNSHFNFWVNNVTPFKKNDTMWTDLKSYMDDPDKAESAITSTQDQFNYLQLKWLFNEKYNLEPFTKWMFKGVSMRPDLLHSDADPNNGGKPFCYKGGTLSTDKLKKQLPLMAPNQPFESVGQLGNVRIGPYETLATVRAYRYGTSLTDFHRVLDYFSATGDRSDPAPVNTSSGEVDYSNSGELFSGIARGRVNLNMPPLVRWNSKKAIRATTDGMLPNPYPVIAAMQGATSALDFSLASKIATRIGATAGEEVVNTKGFRGKNVSKTVVRRLSEIGWAEINGRNPILTDIVTAGADSDAAREAYIGQCANAFTTRGQTFLVIVRADAYTPRYGEEASTGDGTTLATTHAVLELFRDPEYARYPDGSPLEDADGHPVFFHNWYIKSFHVL